MYRWCTTAGPAHAVGGPPMLMAPSHEAQEGWQEARIERPRRPALTLARETEMEAERERESVSFREHTPLTRERERERGLSDRPLIFADRDRLSIC